MHVTQTTTDVYLQVKIRSLASTFGSDFGAQMLDVYARDPAAAGHSTIAAFPQRNYRSLGLTPGASAWRPRASHPSGRARRVPRWAAPNCIDQAGGTATWVLPRSAFGTVGGGWVFTVALTGQAGSKPDQARASAATAQPFAFGVCRAGVSSPICAIDPSTVPKVMDTITPAGVSQASELDPTQGPVSLQGVAVP